VPHVSVNYIFLCSSLLTFNKKRPQRRKLARVWLNCYSCLSRKALVMTMSGFINLGKGHIINQRLGARACRILKSVCAPEKEIKTVTPSARAEDREAPPYNRSRPGMPKQMPCVTHARQLILWTPALPSKSRKIYVQKIILKFAIWPI
jgi:hypothetical protein